MAKNNWEILARERSKENKRAHKKIKEITQSRGLWKDKYMAANSQVKKLEKQLAIVKKNLQVIMDL